MKTKIIGGLLLLVFSQLGYAQDSLVTEARPWVKGEKNLPWKKFNTRTIVQLKGFEPVQKSAVDEYGSDTSYPKSKSTGYFYVKKTGNRWWIIDPKGYRHLQKVVVGIRPGTSERNEKALANKFGTKSKWMEETADMLHTLYFSGSGAWSDENEIAEYNHNHPKTVMTRSIMLDFMSKYGKKRGGTYQLPGHTGYPNQCIFVFDPEFKTFCEEEAQKLAANQADKNIIGYFSDNELPFSKDNLEGYLHLQNPKDPGRVFAETWLKQQGIAPENITDQNRKDFVGVVAEHYYQIVSEAIKKQDPNHMYLGSRLHGKAKFIQQVVEAAGKYCDIVSINYYGDWTPSKTAMQQWGEWAKKPFIITEFYTKAMDSGLANTTGAGFTVHTQKDRGYAYQHFVLGLLESGGCVGWHWFRYQDNDPTAKGADPSNTDSNKGMVDNEYNLYKPLTDAMQELNVNAYRLADWFDQQKNK